MKALPSRHDNVPGWEEHLVAQAKQGEAVAFELLMDMHRPAVRFHAMRMLRDADDAADAVQETFVKAVRGLRGFDQGRPMLPWLLRICSNCCVDLIRSRRNNVESLDAHDYAVCDKSVNIESDVASQLELDRVGAAIDRLPSRYREIVLMRHVDHMDVLDIAAKLHKPEGTIKSWLFRARELLKKDLQLSLA